MITSHMRGHSVYFDGAWRYSDDGSCADDTRPCKRCGKHQTADGYDACLGHVKGATSACCGHGVDAPIFMPEKSIKQIMCGRCNKLINANTPYSAYFRADTSIAVCEECFYKEQNIAYSMTSTSQAE